MTWNARVLLLALALLPSLNILSAQTAASAPVDANKASTTGAAKPAAADANKTATKVDVDPVEDFLTKLKNPTPWLKWGADVRLREEYFLNTTTLNNVHNKSTIHFERYRERVYWTITPIENVEINTRIMFEPRNYQEPTARPNWTAKEAFFDIGNVKWKQIGGLPLTATVGRQDFWSNGKPDFGDGWLIGDGTPLDGSRTFFFDAARLTYESKATNTTYDLIYLNNHADSSAVMEPFHDDNVELCEQNEQGAIFYVKNKSFENTQIDGYFIYKHDEKVLATGDNADIYTFGTRVAGDINANWKYRSEVAGQFGDKNYMNMATLGSNNRLSYFFNDPINNNLRMTYEFRSGRAKGSSTDSEFDILWGRYPQWSEIYNGYTDSLEAQPGRSPNLHRLGPGWGCNPTKNLELSADYYLMFANQNTYAGSPGFSDNGKFRGQLVQLVLRYKFTEHIFGHLIGEAFIPGNYYGSNAGGNLDTAAAFARFELDFKL